MKEMHSINNIMCYRKRKFEKCRFSLFCVAFQGKTHAFSAKMVDGEIQAFNQFEGLLHLKRGIISSNKPARDPQPGTSQSANGLVVVRKWPSCDSKDYPIDYNKTQVFCGKSEVQWPSYASL